MNAARRQRMFANHFAFDRGTRRFWLVEGTMWIRGATLPFVDWESARFILRDVAGKTTWVDEASLRQFYVSVRGQRGVPASLSTSQLIAMLLEELRLDRLRLYDLGSYDVVLVRDIQGVPAQGTSGTPAQVERLGRVIDGLVTVSIRDIDKQREAVFAEFKDELTKSALMTSVMKAVFSGWLAARARDGGSLVVDPILLGLLISVIGTDAFGWLEDLAALLLAMDKATTNAAIENCTVTLANLMIEIGVGAFITLLLGASGVKITRI